MVFAVGFAETIFPVVPLKPVAGDHEYVSAPDAVNVVGEHVELLVITIDGLLLTANVTSLEVVAGVHVPDILTRYLYPFIVAITLFMFRVLEVVPVYINPLGLVGVPVVRFTKPLPISTCH